MNKTFLLNKNQCYNRKVKYALWLTNYPFSLLHLPEVCTDFVIERGHRVGRPQSDSKPCKIVARFLNCKDPEAKKKVHGTNMF